MKVLQRPVESANEGNKGIGEHRAE